MAKHKPLSSSHQDSCNQRSEGELWGQESHGEEVETQAGQGQQPEQN